MKGTDHLWISNSIATAGEEGLHGFKAESRQWCSLPFTGKQNFTRIEMGLLQPFQQLTKAQAQQIYILIKTLFTNITLYITFI